MIMNVLISLLLMVLGAMVAQEVICRSVGALRKLFAILNPQAGYLGLAGLFFSFVWFLECLFTIFQLATNPIGFFMLVIGTLLLFGVGLVLGLDFLRKIVGEPAPAFMLKLGMWRDKLLLKKSELGLTAVIFGVLFIAII